MAQTVGAVATLARATIELPEVPDLPATPHTGERFSGWSVRYDIALIPWLDEMIDYAGARLGLQDRREGMAWLNLLYGKGAEIEEHSEGQAETDWTLVVFLTDTPRGGGGILVVGGEEVEPQAGLCVAFPSQTPHRVTPLLIMDKRVSVGCLWSGRAG